MELELSAYSLATLESNKKFLLGNPIEFYDKNLNRAEVEKTLLELTVKQALKRNTKLYRVRDKSNEITDNLGFFANSKGANALKDEVEKKIEYSKRKIEEISRKIKMIPSEISHTENN